MISAAILDALCDLNDGSPGDGVSDHPSRSQPLYDLTFDTTARIRDFKAGLILYLTFVSVVYHDWNQLLPLDRGV